MLKFNNKLKSLIISIVAALTIAFGAFALLFVSNGKTQEAYAAKQVQLGNVTTTLAPKVSGTHMATETSVELDLTVTNTNATGIGGFMFTVVYDSTVFSYVSHTCDSNKFDIDTDDTTTPGQVGITLASLMKGDTAGNFTATTITFSVSNPASQTYNFTVQGMAVTSSDVMGGVYTPTVNSASISYRALSSDTSLTQLKVNNVDITSSLSGTTFTLPSSSKVPYKTTTVTINATKNSTAKKAEVKNSTVTWSGTSGTINNAVLVTAENGATQYYSITLTREDPKQITNGTITLNGGGLSNKVITLDSATTSYTLDTTIDYENHKKVNVKAAVAANSDATITSAKFNNVAQNGIYGNSGYTPNLVKGTGANTIEVTITAEDSAISTKYTLIINVGAPVMTLSKVTCGTFTDSNGADGWEIGPIPYSTYKNGINVVGTPTSSLATISSGSVTISKADRDAQQKVVTLTLTMDNGDTSTHQVTVKLTKPSTVTDGKITLSGGEFGSTGEVITLTSSETSYTASKTVDYENHKEITVKAEATSPATVTDNNLKNGYKPVLNKTQHTITVKIQAEDPDVSTTYSVKINVGEPDMTLKEGTVKLGSYVGTYNEDTEKWEIYKDADGNPIPYADSKDGLTLSAELNSTLAAITGGTGAISFVPDDYSATQKEVTINVKMDNNDTKSWTVLISLEAPKGDATGSVIFSGSYEKTNQLGKGTNIDIPYSGLSGTFIKIEPDDENAQVTEIKLNDAAFTNNTKATLQLGENTLEVTITPQDESKAETYNMTLTVLSPSLDLDSIKLGDYKGVFNVSDKVWEIGKDSPVTYKLAKDGLTLSADPTIKTATVTGIGKVELTKEDYETGKKELTLTVKLGDADPQEWPVTIYIAPLNKNANIASVTLTNGSTVLQGVAPEEGSDTWTFSQQIPADQLTGWTLSAEPEVSTTAINGTGEVTLTASGKTVTLTAIAEGGSALGKTETWKVEIKVAAADVDTSKDLGSLKLSYGDNQSYVLKDANRDERSYELSATDNDGVKLLATAKDVSSVVYISDASAESTAGNFTGGTENSFEKALNLETGTNYVVVKIEAKNGQSKNYTITIIVLGSGNETGLKGNGVTFKDGKLDYVIDSIISTDVWDIYIPLKTTSVKLDVDLKDSTTKVVKIETIDKMTQSVLKTYNTANSDISLIEEDNNSSDPKRVVGKVVVTVKSTSGATREYSYIIKDKIVNIGIKSDKGNLNETVDFYSRELYKRYIEAKEDWETWEETLVLPVGYHYEVICGDVTKPETTTADGTLVAYADEESLSFNIKEGLNSILLRVYNDNGESYFLAFSVDKPVKGGSGGLSTGALVAIIILSVLFVAAAVVMAVFIGKYMSLANNQSNNAGRRDDYRE